MALLKRKLKGQIAVEGRMRMISKFLYLPMTINGDTRWLENVMIMYYAKESYTFENGVAVPDLWWEAQRFISYIKLKSN